MYQNNISQSEVESAISDIKTSRAAKGPSATPARPGVYGIYLRTKGLLRPFEEGDDGLIYIGTSKNLARFS